MPRFSAAQRLDRLPIGAFHRRILLLIGAGMFLDNFDATLQGGVLGALTASTGPRWLAMPYPRGGVDLVLGSFCGLLLFQALAVFLFGIRTENRPREELAPEEAPLGMTGAKAVKA